MKSNASSYRFTREIEEVINAAIDAHTPAFKKKFRPFRREMLRTAVIENLIESYELLEGWSRNVVLWNMCYKSPVRMPFSTRHPDYDLALKKRGPTLADKIKNGTGTDAFSDLQVLNASMVGQYSAQWNWAESCGDLKRFGMSNG